MNRNLEKASRDVAKAEGLVSTLERYLQIALAKNRERDVLVALNKLISSLKQTIESLTDEIALLQADSEVVDVILTVSKAREDKN